MPPKFYKTITGTSESMSSSSNHAEYHEGAILTAPVSVVIPCYRCTETIRRAVESAVFQSMKPVEIILVDDASQDGTLEILNNLVMEFGSGLKVISLKENQGAASARNAGWEIATQPYIAFLDADDAWHKRKIEIQYEFMKMHPEVQLCGHTHRLFQPEESGFNWDLGGCADSKKITAWGMLLKNRFVTPSVMIRQELYHRFNEQQHFMEDHLLWSEIICGGGLAVKLPIPLAAIYKHPFGVSGLSSQMWEMTSNDVANYWRLYQKRCINWFQLGVLIAYAALKSVRRYIVYLRCKYDV